MMPFGRRAAAVLAAILVTTPLMAVSATTDTATAREQSVTGPAPTSEDAQAVLDWERTLIRTVYTEAATPVPIGVLYLGFTSVALFEAVKTAQKHGNSSAAAAAVAAHDTLLEYFPASQVNLDLDLAASLAAVPNGQAKERGVRVGAQAAAHMIESRVDDGRNDTSIVYERSPEPGVWQPAPGGAMLGAWIGFVRPLLLRTPIKVNGPDPVTSAAYAFDYQEVKRTGAATGADRTPYQSETATFFNSNSAIMVGEALLRRFDDNPLSLRTTARMFAVIHGAMTDAVITCWRLKYDVGFWRPFQAIQGATTDGNPATVPIPAGRR